MPIRATWLVVGAGLALAAPGATAGPSVPATSHLIFTSNRDGDAHAYATDPAGRRLAALTVGTRDDSLVVVSRDGRHIAFRRSERRGFGVYVADGGGRHLARVGQGDPVGWSPNGSLLAFFFIGGSVVEPTGISVVGADGTGARKLVGGEGSYTEFDGWSPDGQELAYTVEAVDPSTGDIDTELRTVDLAGTEKVLSSQLGETWFSAAWAPSGHRLAYRRFADGGSQVAVVDADTGATSVVAKGSDAFGPPVWSPDGTKLLYSRGDAGANSLEVADLGTGATTQLVRTAYVDYEPTPAWAWSPAGDRVVWSDAAGLFTVAADGRNRARLLKATWRGWAPHATWSPDGSRVAFVLDSLHTIRPDGTGLRTLARRGSIELVGWVRGGIPSSARAAPRLPALEHASHRLLRLRGRVKELVASGATAGVVSARSRLDCVHVVAWSPRAAAVARATQPNPCHPLELPEFFLVGGLDIFGTTLTWSSDWTCGNTECDRVDYTGRLRRPRLLHVDTRLLTVERGNGPPNLPCVVCPASNPTRGNPDVVPGHAAVYLMRNEIVIRLLPSRRQRVLRPGGVGPVFARLTRAGLFYAYSLAGGAYPGRVAFVPLSRLTAT